MNFIYGFLIAIAVLAVAIEIGLRVFVSKQERKKRRYIWEQELLNIAKDGVWK